MPYRSLDPDRIVKTLERLSSRVHERFPGRGLSQVCSELLQVAREDAARCAWAEKPNYRLRVAVALLLALGIGGLTWLIWRYRVAVAAIETETFHAFQGVEALINIVLLTGAGVWFVLNQESRLKRRRVLEDLHELRSMAHVIDMHQLTKDPTSVLDNSRATASSYRHDLSEFELTRYLDYCTEMLALIGKLAALYMRGTRDAVILQAVNEIEDLSAGLTRKIWQKIMIIQGRQNDAPETIKGVDGLSQDCEPARQPSAEERPST